MINMKMTELANDMFNRLKKKYPEIKLNGFSNSPESENSLWLNVAMPSDEDREIEIREYAAEIATDVLDEYGFMLVLIPERNGVSSC